MANCERYKKKKSFFIANKNFLHFFCCIKDEDGIVEIVRDEELESNVIQIATKGSLAKTFITIPSRPHLTLGITNPYLIIQCKNVLNFF